MRAVVTVTADRYVEMLETFLRPQLDDVDTEHVWFQQDGATAHTARRSLGGLRELFPGRLISLRGDVGCINVWLHFLSITRSSSGSPNT